MPKKVRIKKDAGQVTEQSKACSICFMAIPVQIYNELLRGKSICCPHCDAALILKKHNKKNK